LERLSYPESYRRAKNTFELFGNPKPEISARPRHDDDDPGPSILRYRLVDCDLSHLTLYGLFIGRSELRKVTFRDTDMHLSTFCWNDFVECDFTEANLQGSDLRSSIFTSCIFRNTNLEGCDLRHSTFEKCVFQESKMSGAILTHGQRPTLKLSRDQRKGVRWKFLSGALPEGG